MFLWHKQTGHISLVVVQQQSSSALVILYNTLCDDTCPECSFTFPPHISFIHTFLLLHGAAHLSILKDPTRSLQKDRCFVHSFSNYIPLPGPFRLIIQLSVSFSLSIGKPLLPCQLLIRARSGQRAQIRLTSSNIILTALNNEKS